MKLRTIGFALVLAVMPFAGQAAKIPDLSHVVDPGEWAYSVETTMQVEGASIPAKTVANKKCITQEQLDENNNWFSTSSNKQCTTEAMNYSGHVLTFTQKCRMGGGNLTVQGKMTIESSTAYHGVIDTTGSIAGQGINGHTTIEAHRTGSCTEAESGQ